MVTIAAILGMAAHLEGRGCGMIDMAGLAQKGGAVFSHVKLARAPQDIHAIRIAPGGADLILGCDLVVSGSRAVLSTAKGAATGVVVNAAEVLPGDFTRNPDFALPADKLKRAIQSAAGGAARFVDATAAAVAALGNSIGANLFMLGYAYQAGFVPLSSLAIRRAIELNGEAVEMNLAAFAWGRAAFAKPAALADFAPAAAPKTEDLPTVVARRVAYLTAYQNQAYAERYRALVDEVAAAEAAKAPGRSGLALAVARYAFKLMAYKDEYEVARLYTDGAFAKSLLDAFDGDLKVTFHLAPPILGRKKGGVPVKTAFGPWMKRAFTLLAACKGLRGGPLDVFGYSQERRAERRLVDDYFALVGELIAKLDSDNHRARRVAGLASRKGARLWLREGARPRRGQGGMGEGAGRLARRRGAAAGGGVGRGRRPASPSTNQPSARQAEARLDERPLRRRRAEGEVAAERPHAVAQAR